MTELGGEVGKEKREEGRGLEDLNFLKSVYGYVLIKNKYPRQVFHGLVLAAHRA